MWALLAGNCGPFLGVFGLELLKSWKFLLDCSNPSAAQTVLGSLPRAEPSKGDG